MDDASALEISDDENEEPMLPASMQQSSFGPAHHKPYGDQHRPPITGAESSQRSNPPWYEQAIPGNFDCLPSTQSSTQFRRLPGPAGALERGGRACGSQLSTQPSDPMQQPGDKRARTGFFHRTDAWTELERAISSRAPGMEIPGRMGLQQVQKEASKPPPVPLRARLICALIKSIGTKESSGDDVPVTLADETGEMDGTLHGKVFNEHPGLLTVGAALAIKDVPVLSLSVFSHHLIIHPTSIVLVVPPLLRRHSSRAANTEGGHVRRRHTAAHADPTVEDGFAHANGMSQAHTPGPSAPEEAPVVGGRVDAHSSSSSPSELVSSTRPRSQPQQHPSPLSQPLRELVGMSGRRASDATDQGNACLRGSHLCQSVPPHRGHADPLSRSPPNERDQLHHLSVPPPSAARHNALHTLPSDTSSIVRPDRFAAVTSRHLLQGATRMQQTSFSCFTTDDQPTRVQHPIREHSDARASSFLPHVQELLPSQPLQQWEPSRPHALRPQDTNEEGRRCTSWKTGEPMKFTGSVDDLEIDDDDHF